MAASPIAFGTCPLGNTGRPLSDVAKLELVSSWFDHVRPPVQIDVAANDEVAARALARALARLEISPRDVALRCRLGGAQTQGDDLQPTWDKVCSLLGEYRPRVAVLEIGADAGNALAAGRALAALRDHGDFSAFGVAGRRWRALADICSVLPIDRVQLLGGYTVLRHPPDLSAFMESLRVRGIGIHLSSIFESGFLVGGQQFDGRALRQENDADRSLLVWRKSFVALCEAHGVTPAHACVQFALAGPGVVALTINTSQVAHVRSCVAAAESPPPPQFWQSLKEEGLVANDYS